MNDPTLSSNVKTQLKGMYNMLSAESDVGGEIAKAFAKAVVTLELYVAIAINPLSIVVIQALPEKYRDKLANLLKA